MGQNWDIDITFLAYQTIMISLSLLDIAFAEEGLRIFWFKDLPKNLDQSILYGVSNFFKKTQSLAVIYFYWLIMWEQGIYDVSCSHVLVLAWFKLENWYFEKERMNE